MPHTCVRLGNGISVDVHWTLAAGIVLLSLVGVVFDWSVSVSVVFVLAVYSGQWLHEFGHVFAFRWLVSGAKVRVLLYMIGGLALPLEPDIIATSYTTKKLSKSLVHFAGPAVNLVLGAVFLVPALTLDVDELAVVAWVNMFIGLYNLVPVAPLDGGEMVMDFVVAMGPELHIACYIVYTFAIVVVLAIVGAQVLLLPDIPLVVRLSLYVFSFASVGVSMFRIVAVCDMSNMVPGRREYVIRRLANIQAVAKPVAEAVSRRIISTSSFLVNTAKSFRSVRHLADTAGKRGAPPVQVVRVHKSEGSAKSFNELESIREIESLGEPATPQHSVTAPQGTPSRASGQDRATAYTAPGRPQIGSLSTAASCDGGDGSGSAAGGPGDARRGADGAGAGGGASNAGSAPVRPVPSDDSMAWVLRSEREREQSRQQPRDSKVAPQPGVPAQDSMEWVMAMDV